MTDARTTHQDVDLELILDPLHGIDVSRHGPRGELAGHVTDRAGTRPAGDPETGGLPRTARVVVVGAGFGGIDAAIRLVAAGEGDVVVLERAAGPSGCWRANTYPGVACDVPSNLYSFSFAPNPNWSRTYSPGGEIEAYIEQVAREYGVYEHIHFNVSVERAQWVDADQQWEIRTNAGTIRASFLINATGPLTEPSFPDVPGRETFVGTQMHTARWDHDVDLAGKRVAVVGTGASAIQVVPQVAQVAAQVDVYQRTAPWVLPRTDRPTTAVERWAFRRFPVVQRWSRGFTYYAREVLVAGMRGNRVVRGVLEALGRAQLRRQVTDPEFRAQLTPAFEVGCKRILLSNTWYPALGRANVAVVAGGVQAITESGVVGADGEAREADVIIYGTGFHVTDAPIATTIFGADGRSLADHWQGSPTSYLGTTVDGFPNLFMLVGPNSGVGHTSILLMIEWQVGYLVQAITEAARLGYSSYSLRPEVMREWVQEIDRLSEGTVWLDGGCSSYYLDATGRNRTTWPTYTWKLRDRLAFFDAAAYVPQSAPVTTQAR